MKITLYGGVVGDSLLTGSVLSVRFKNIPQPGLVAQVLPGASQDANGQLVVSQTIGSDPNKIASQVVDNISIDSTVLTVAIFAAVGIVAWAVYKVLK